MRFQTVFVIDVFSFVVVAALCEFGVLVVVTVVIVIVRIFCSCFVSMTKLFCAKGSNQV